MDGCLFKARGAHQYLYSSVCLCISSTSCLDSSTTSRLDVWRCQPARYLPSIPFVGRSSRRALRLVRFHAANNGGPLSEIDDLIRQKSTADVFVEVQRDPSWHLVGQLFFTFLLYEACTSTCTATLLFV